MALVLLGNFNSDLSIGGGATFRTLLGAIELIASVTDLVWKLIV